MVPPPFRKAASTGPSGTRSWPCILQGVYARYVADAGAGDQGSVDGFPVQIGRLFELAADALKATP
jgi:hypothetical protein